MKQTEEKEREGGRREGVERKRPEGRSVRPSVRLSVCLSVCRACGCSVERPDPPGRFPPSFQFSVLNRCFAKSIVVRRSVDGRDL